MYYAEDPRVALRTTRGSWGHNTNCWDISFLVLFVLECCSDAKRVTIVPFWYISPLLVQFSTIPQNMVHFTKLWYNSVFLY